MSELSKRDNQAKVIYKLAAFASKINASTSIADITVRHQELEAGWERLKILQDEVLDRAGETKLEEQEQIADSVHDAYITASVKFTAHVEQLQQNASIQVSTQKVPTLSDQAINQ